MKHPALTRMLAVFLAVAAALSLTAGGISIGKTETEYKQAQRQAALLEERAARAEQLQHELEQKAGAFDDAAARLPELREAYRKDASAYRRDLGTYTATRAGVVMGQEQLDKASAAMQKGLEQFESGYAMLQQVSTLVNGLYQGYLGARQGFDSGWSAYQQGQKWLADGGGEEQPDVLQPEQILAINAAMQQALGQARGELAAYRDGVPEGQSQAAERLKELLPTLSGLSEESLRYNAEQYAYEAALAAYERAGSALEQGTEAGLSPEDARAAADALSEQLLGMSYEELGRWLEENRPEEPEPSASGGLELSPEMLEGLDVELPTDRELLDQALALLDDTLLDLQTREASFRADPEAMNSPELALAFLEAQLSSGERLMALISPLITDAKSRMDTLLAQMDQAYAALKQGQELLWASYRELYATDKGLADTLEELKERKAALEEQSAALAELESVDAERDALTRQSRTARAILLENEEIAERVDAGEELLSAAAAQRQALAEQSARERKLRLVSCTAMLAAGLLGIVTVLGCFEKPKMKALWLPALLCLLCAAGGEAVSLMLGRGLWYTGVFTGVMALSLFPLTLQK